MNLQRLQELTNEALDAQADADSMCTASDENVYAKINHYHILLTKEEARTIINRYVREKREKHEKAKKEISLLNI
jgi:hypothetical protein